MKRALLILVATTAANAQIVATSGRNFVVAHDGAVDVFDADARRIATYAGVAHPTSLATTGEHIAVVDAFANEVRIVGFEPIATGETPVAAVFAGRDLYVLARDASRLEHIGGESIAVARDPAFLRESNGRLYVYSRLDGVLQEIATGPLRIVRQTAIAPFASDFQIDGRTGYLVFPDQANVRAISLETMTADPGESFAHAFARGFLGGLLGFTIGAPEVPAVPDGVDRIERRGASAIAYDSMTGTLYRLGRRKPQVVATGLSPQAFALTRDAIAVWQNGALRLIR